MKIISKDGLVLGGLYFVSSILFKFWDNSFAEFISSFLFFAFLLFAVRLQFGKAPVFVRIFPVKFPKLTVYIKALGWIPYFEVLAGLVVILASLLFVSGDNKIGWIIPYIPFLYVSYALMILGSLLYGFKKSKA